MLRIPLSLIQPNSYGQKRQKLSKKIGNWGAGEKIKRRGFKFWLSVIEIGDKILKEPCR